MKKKSIRKPVRKVRRGQKNIFTNADKMGMLSMYHKDGLTLSEIAEHYGTTRQYVGKIIKELEKNVEILKGVMYFNPDEVLNRKKLDPFERQKLLNEDAMDILEGVFSLVKYKVNTTINIIAAGKELGALGVDLEHLNKLISSSIPYVLPKVENKKAKQPTGDAKSPQMKMHKLMVSNNAKTA